MPDYKDLTKRQHYHMRAILKNFSLGEDLCTRTAAPIASLTKTMRFTDILLVGSNRDSLWSWYWKKGGWGRYAIFLLLAEYQPTKIYRSTTYFGGYAICMPWLRSQWPKFIKVLIPPRWNILKIGRTDMEKSPLMGMALLMACLQRLLGFKRVLNVIAKNIMVYFCLSELRKMVGWFLQITIVGRWYSLCRLTFCCAASAQKNKSLGLWLAKKLARQIK